MLGRSQRRLEPDNTWPGFVDALSSLLLVIIFLLSMFVLAQFFLGQILSGKDAALEELKGKVAELSDMLKLEQDANAQLRFDLGQLTSSLQAARLDRDDALAQVNNLQQSLADANRRLDEARQSGATTAADLDELEARYATSQEELEEQRQLTISAQQEVTRLSNALNALREQLARLNAALEASEQRDKEQQAVIADLGRRLNVALAAKVEELAQYRSEFYGRLRQVLNNRSDIRIEGDRFIFQSELLFASGSAELGEAGQEELAKFAETLLEIAATIPDEIDWILRVDGHTDPVPIFNNEFRSNWELSTSRALTVVQNLIQNGIPANRLAATGFGEFQPLVPGQTDEANRRNRRIEMRFTQK